MIRRLALVVVALVSVWLTLGRGAALSLVAVAVIFVWTAKRRTPRFPLFLRRMGTERAFSVEQRRQIYDRDGGLCQYCLVLDRVARMTHFGVECPAGEDGDDACFEADHVVPWSKGGLTTLDNAVTACRRHNRMKSDRSVEDFIANP